ncbi:MAG: hypothetical protein KA243_01070 [Candidatus Aminicenantes bacterium]|nr:hypothetical protein [Candidatus Aminicenantes bacterium]
MADERTILYTAQQDLLVPAFEMISELLKGRRIEAKVTTTDDSRTISFLDKNGRECEYECHLTSLESPRVYRNFKLIEGDHGLRGHDFSGQFVDKVTPRIVIADFSAIFKFHI